MKRALTQTLLATLFVAAAACAARAQSTQQKDDPPPPPPIVYGDPKVEQPFGKGRLEGGSYSNDFFGLSFTLPKTWVVLAAAENEKLMDMGKEAVEQGASERKKLGLESSLMRTQVLVTASKYPTGVPSPGFNAVLICIAERIPTAIIKTGADYIAVTQRTLEGTAAKLEMSGPLRTEKIGGADFTVADMKMTVGTVVAAQRYYVRITKGYALALAYSYYDDADLKALDEVLGTFKFK